MVRKKILLGHPLSIVEMDSGRFFDRIQSYEKIYNISRKGKKILRWIEENNVFFCFIDYISFLFYISFSDRLLQYITYMLM